MTFNTPTDRRGTHSSKWDKMEQLYGVSPDDGLAMWTADSDYQTAPCVIDAVRRAAEHGVFGYSWKHPEYLASVQWWMQTRHDWQIDTDWVLTSQGLGNAIALCLDVWSEPGDGAVIFTPVYHEFAHKVNKSGRRVVECPLVRAGCHRKAGFCALSLPKFRYGGRNMGLLVDGTWHDTWYDTKSTGGAFKRSAAQFRNWLTADGSAGASGKGSFKAEPGRYHLYVSHACPWAHRTLIFRELKGLTDLISVSVVHPDMLDKGWSFETDDHGATGDDLYGLDYAHQVYTKADPAYSGRVTVPILWDKQQETIVSNESSEIIRMFNSAFNEITGNCDDYWP
jgi:hypothetical protein